MEHSAQGPKTSGLLSQRHLSASSGLSQGTHSSSGTGASSPQRLSPSAPLAAVNAEFVALAEKAHHKFARLRELPQYGRTRWHIHFHKAFHVYARLWCFQQEHRTKLLSVGLQRWEIGDIASRIGQLYYNYYARTGELAFLLEAFVFYEALSTREYLRESARTDRALANKQLRVSARFILVSLLLNRRQVAATTLLQLRELVEEYARTFEPADAREWSLVVDGIARFVAADSACDTTRSMRYQAHLDKSSAALPPVASLAGPDAPTQLRLQEAVLTSFHQNEVNFSEFTLDTFRMLQAVEYEPRAKSASGQESSEGDNGSRVSKSRRARDASQPTNPHKYILHKPNVPQLLLVLATALEELPAESILLLYISASGPLQGSMPLASNGSLGVSGSTPPGRTLSPPSATVAIGKPAGKPLADTDTTVSPKPGRLRAPESRSPHGAGSGEGSTLTEDDSGVWLGRRKADASPVDSENVYLHALDLVPFTRRPLFIIVDSNNSAAFEVLVGRERGEKVALLLSPSIQPPTLSPNRHSLHPPSTTGGDLFTLFLTAPLVAFCHATGVPVPATRSAELENAERQLAGMLTEWGITLAAVPSLDAIWGRVFSDPFLHLFILRFVLCRAVFATCVTYRGRSEYLPRCHPWLPEEVGPEAEAVLAGVYQLAATLGAEKMFPTPYSDGGDDASEESLVVHETEPRQESQEPAADSRAHASWQVKPAPHEIFKADSRVGSLRAAPELSRFSERNKGDLVKEDVSSAAPADVEYKRSGRLRPNSGELSQIELEMGLQASKPPRVGGGGADGLPVASVVASSTEAALGAAGTLQKQEAAVAPQPTSAASASTRELPPPGRTDRAEGGPGGGPPIRSGPVRAPAKLLLGAEKAVADRAERERSRSENDEDGGFPPPLGLLQVPAPGQEESSGKLRSWSPKVLSRAWSGGARAESFGVDGNSSGLQQGPADDAKWMTHMTLPPDLDQSGTFEPHAGGTNFLKGALKKPREPVGPVPGAWLLRKQQQQQQREKGQRQEAEETTSKQAEAVLKSNSKFVSWSWSGGDRSRESEGNLASAFEKMYGVKLPADESAGEAEKMPGGSGGTLPHQGTSNSNSLAPSQSQRAGSGSALNGHLSSSFNRKPEEWLLQRAATVDSSLATDDPGGIERGLGGSGVQDTAYFLSSMEGRNLSRNQKAEMDSSGQNDDRHFFKRSLTAEEGRRPGFSSTGRRGRLFASSAGKWGGDSNSTEAGDLFGRLSRTSINPTGSGKGKDSTPGRRWGWMKEREKEREDREGESSGEAHISCNPLHSMGRGKGIGGTAKAIDSGLRKLKWRGSAKKEEGVENPKEELHWEHEDTQGWGPFGTRVPSPKGVPMVPKTPSNFELAYIRLHNEAPGGASVQEQPVMRSHSIPAARRSELPRETTLEMKPTKVRFWDEETGEEGGRSQHGSRLLPLSGELGRLAPRPGEPQVWSGDLGRMGSRSGEVGRSATARSGEIAPISRRASLKVAIPADSMSNGAPPWGFSSGGNQSHHGWRSFDSPDGLVRGTKPWGTEVRRGDVPFRLQDIRKAEPSQRATAKAGSFFRWMGLRSAPVDRRVS